MLFFLWRSLPYWTPLFINNSSVVDDDDLIRVFYANINSQNKAKEKLITYLEETQPDIVFLTEVNSSWAKEIKKLEPLYPHAKMIVREGNFGLAVLSQSLLEVQNVFVDRKNMIPALFLRAHTSLESVNLALLHAFPPIGSYGTLLRNQYVDALSFKIGEIESPLLVCGDFNTTPWSSVFQRFLEKSSLSTAKNYILPSTWPTTPFLPSLAIDHCLSRGLSFVKYGKGPDIGSDHWPLIIHLSREKRTVASESKME